jgi:methyl-accepting chemotaxis protein
MPTTWTIGRKITCGFALSLIALFVIGWISYRSLDILIGASNQVTQSNLVRTGLSDLLSLLKDAETGQRGFVITGDEAFLDPYTSGTSEAPKALARLRQLLAADSPQRAALDQIDALVQGKFDELKLTIEMRRKEGFEATQKVVGAGKGKRIMDDLRQIIGRIDQEQKDVLGRKAQEAQQASDSAKATIIAGTAIGVVLVALAGFLIVTGLTRQLGAAVGDMQSSAAELQAAAQQQATGAKEQATAMNEIATTISELLATSRQIADSSQHVAQIADKTAASARSGDATVQHARDAVGGVKRQVDLIVTHMLDLGKKSQQIGAVLDLINELAEQTNILAINATIEAAGAGDAGRRFAVVADEIRKLADRVGGSTKEIRVLIDDVRSAVNTTVMVTEAGSKAVESGSAQVGAVASSFTAIASLVETTTAAAQEIGLSTKQQTTAVEQVTLAITSVSQASKESEVSTTQTLQTASQLSALARDLSRLIRS